MKIVNDSDRGDDEGEGGSGDSEPSVQVLYTPTPDEDTRFDSYRFRLESAGDAPRWDERPAAGAPQRVLFRHLVPGRLYNLTMWTVSRNVTSHPVQQQTRLCTYRPPLSRTRLVPRPRAPLTVRSVHRPAARTAAQRDRRRRARGDAAVGEATRRLHGL